MTTHWNFDNSKLSGINLTLEPINGASTSANLAGLPKNILNLLHISKQLYCITPDNTSNNNITMSQILSNFEGLNRV